jgi:transcriptional regulator with XRE-family HTH domain
MTTFVEKVVSTEAGERGFNREWAILELTELICEVMEREGVTREELARRMGRSKGFVTQLLDGRANMTIRTVADVFTALGRTIHFRNSGAGIEAYAQSRMD